MATLENAKAQTVALGAIVAAVLAAAIAAIALLTEQSVPVSALAGLVAALALTVAWLDIRRGRAAKQSSIAPTEPVAGASDATLLNTVRRVSRIGTWKYEYDTGRATWSDEVAAIHGQPAGHSPDLAEILSYYVAPDGERLSAAIGAAIDSGEPFMEECLIDGGDGVRRSIMIIGEPVVDKEGRPQQLRGTIQDLTPWREAESTAEMEQRRFSQVTSSLPIAVWGATADGVVDYISDTLATYAGGNVHEFEGNGWLTLIHPADQEMMTAQWQSALQGGQNYEVECRIRDRHGEYRWHSVSAKPERADDGSILRWWGSSIDVHRTRALEQRAHQLAHDRDVILDSISDGVLAIDRDWRIAYLNDHAQEMLGRSREALVGTDIFSEYPALRNTAVHTAYRAAMSTREPQFLTFHDEVRSRWLEITATPSPLGITAFLRDVTETRVLGEQLEQAQRLESVGRLTGGIAHDFNNLLTVVIGGADAVSRDPGASQRSQEMIALVRQAAERGAQLTSRLLAFARRQPLAPQHTDINRLLTEFEPLLHRTLGNGITISTMLEQEVPPALVDRSQFESAVLNLAINARDAMPDGGTLVIETALRHLDESYVTAHAEVDPGTYVVVTVTDSGTGIEPEALDRLFDPFFTTKDVGHGSGMGLAMVWGFTRQSGGHVTVYSEVGHGTSFRLYLPLAPGGAASIESKREAITPPARGSGTILLAEDDPLVRAFATEHLRSMGYDVVPASSGPQALELLAQMATIDLLFTDVIMPNGMTGRDLADRVTEDRPGTPVLYASGYTENVIMHNGKLDEGVALLAKPYSAQELAVRVHEQMSVKRRGER